MQLKKLDKTLDGILWVLFLALAGVALWWTISIKAPKLEYVESEKIPYVYTADEITWILQNKGYNCSRIVSVTPTYTEMGNILSLRFDDSAGVSWTFSRSRASTILNS